MKIRKYSERDNAQVVGLLKKTFPNDPGHNEPSTVVEAKLAVDDLIFVAVEDEIIVGVVIAGYDGHRGWLYSVAVDKSNQANGVGRRLVQYAVEALKNMGCIKVNLQIRSTNSDVVAFYRKLGFVTEERVSMGKLLI
ncbi:MAG: GNAT family acetyltransferase [Halieaceae bacterium]|jgi:ribosomal protein S18 acetylase RimI-like enzyme|nr:GNAT family acetyltransferase [Halieaceae bacterium]